MNAVDATTRRVLRDPLWRMILATPALLFVARRVLMEGSPSTPGEWGFEVVFVIVLSALVAVVLLGVRQGWQMLRSGAGTARDRVQRRAESDALAQTMVGIATLTVLIVASAWALAMAVG